MVDVAAGTIAPDPADIASRKAARKAAAEAMVAGAATTFSDDPGSEWRKADEYARQLVENGRLVEVRRDERGYAVALCCGGYDVAKFVPCHRNDATAEAVCERMNRSARQ